MLDKTDGEKMNNIKGSNPLCSFVAVSDLHITPRLRTKTAGKRRSAWKWIEQNHPDFCLMAGDITNGCGADEFEIAKSELEPLARKIPFFVGYGNHDYIPNNSGAIASPEARSNFSAWADKAVASHGGTIESFGDNRCFSSRFCNIQIISMDCAASYPSAIAGEEQLEWLDKMLSETDSDRFRIVMSHFPLNNYVPSRTGKKQMSYVRDSSKQQKLFEKHKNILFFSGHTHFSLDLESPAVLFDEENRIAYCNTASVGNVVPNAQAVKRGETENASGSMGLYVEVYEKHIEVIGVDFLNDKTIDRCEFEIEM